MSKWTDVRDNIVDALHVEDITEDVKQHVTNTILSEVMPVIENAVDSFCATTKEQAKNGDGLVQDPRWRCSAAPDAGRCGHHQNGTQQDDQGDGCSDGLIDVGRDFPPLVFHAYTLRGLAMRCNLVFGAHKLHTRCIQICR